MASKDSRYTNPIGYYFIVFQSNLRGYIKCWMDGSEDYTYFSEEDFIGLFEKAGSINLRSSVLDCISTTGIYLWDVSGGRIRRLSNIYERSLLREDMNSMNPLLRKNRNSEDVLERRIF